MNTRNKFSRLNNKNSNEEKIFREILNIFKKRTLPDEELMENLFMYLQKKDLSHLLFLSEVYQKIVNIHGNIFEFGTRWGRNVSLLCTLRGLFEPYNHTRKVIAFDTFSGFPNISSKDGKHQSVQKGSYKVSRNYQEYLDQLLSIKESELPISHIKKFDIVKGDVSLSSKKYFRENPESLVALAIFDLDLFEPTKNALKTILPRMSKGSIIIFDELNHTAYPGETLAYLEVFKSYKFKLFRSPISASKSYIIIE
jgi:hypothetical protein